MKNLAFLTLLILSLASCKQDPVRTDEIFTLSFEQTRTLQTSLENFEITFTDLKEDSRCPQNVNCIWAGRAVVEISVNEHKMLLGVGDLSTGGTEYVQKQEYNGLVYELIDVFFDEEKNRGLEKHYAISIKVSRAN